MPCPPFPRLLLSGLLLLLAVVGASAADTPPAARTLPDGIKVPAGFTATLFAAPPEVNYPVCLSAAPSGELFVGIDQNGSLDTKTGRGRIVRCVDTNHDGHADQFTTFADNIDSPRGLIYDGNTLFVLHPPFLRALRDRDGDGVAEENQLLVEGIGPDLNFRGADHTINGIRMGIDGWIYIAAGDYGFVKATGRDGQSLQLHGGGIVRVRPEGIELELYARGLRNICDVAVSPTLDAFTRDNTNDGGGWNVRLSHIVALAHYGYPSLFVNFADEIMPPLADYGGGSPTGSLFLDEPAFPSPFGTALYTCDWGRSIIYRHPLEARGAGFKAGQETFIQISRPTDMDADGEGRLYVGSWQGGGFNYSGPNVGYVVRVVPTDSKPAPFPDVTTANESVLLTLLGSGSQVARLTAQRELLRRGEIKGLAEKLEQLASASGPLAGRIAALFTLKQLLGSRAHKALVRLAAVGELREYALRALTDRASQLNGVLRELFVSSLKDPNPRVQTQALIGLTRLGAADAAPAILPLTSSSDTVIAQTAVKSLVALRAVAPALQAMRDPAMGAGALRVLRELHDSQAVTELIAALGQTADSSFRRQVLATLARLYYREADWKGSWWGTRPDTAGPYFQRVTWDQSAAIAEILRSILDGSDADLATAALVEMRRNKIEWPELSARLLQLAGQKPQLKDAAIDLLIAQRNLPNDAVPLLARIAHSPEEPVESRVRALEALRRIPTLEAFQSAIETLILLATVKNQLEANRGRENFIRDGSHGARVADFIALASDGNPARSELAYSVLLQIAGNRRGARAGRASAEQAIEQAWSNKERTVALLHAIGETKAQQYAPQVRARLNDEDPALKSAAVEAANQLKLNSSAPKETASSIEKLSLAEVVAQASKDKGERALGEQLFTRQGCTACHTTSADQPLKGPYLGGIATRYSRSELTESIIKPNAKVAQGFATHSLELNDGNTVEGFVTRESGDEVEVRNVAGLATTVAKSNIVKRGTQEKSMMPEGLVSMLTVHDFASLLAYLESLDAK